MTDIFVVVSCDGAYSDKEENIFGAYTDAEAAIATVKAVIRSEAVSAMQRESI